MLDVIVLVIIGGMAVWGYRAGMVKSVFRLGYYIIAAIVAALVYPYIASLLGGTPVAGWIDQNIVSKYLAMDAAGESLPSFFSRFVQGAAEQTAGAVTQAVLNIFSVLLVFIVVTIGLRVIVKLLDTIASLPVLSLFNRLGGLAIGLINGAIIVYALLMLMMLITLPQFLQLLEGSTLAKDMYYNNVLLGLIIK